MTTKQKDSAESREIKENFAMAQKAQKEAADLSFKQDARRTAVQLASRNTTSATQMIAEAEKIYQWLIKPVK